MKLCFHFVLIIHLIHQVVRKRSDTFISIFCLKIVIVIFNSIECAHTCTHTITYAHTHYHIRTHTLSHTYTHTLTCACTQARTYADIHTHRHRRSFTHTYTDILIITHKTIWLLMVYRWFLLLMVVWSVILLKISLQVNSCILEHVYFNILCTFRYGLVSITRMSLTVSVL